MSVNTAAPRQSIPRNPTPLQVSHISSPVNEGFSQASPRGTDISISSQDGSGSSEVLYSPISSRSSPGSFQDFKSSPLERSDEPVPTINSKESVQSHAQDGPKSSPLATPKANAYRQVRNISAPLYSSNTMVESPPRSPPDMAPPKTRATPGRPEQELTHRTSSIDSTTSSISSAQSYPQISPLDPLSPNPAEIAQLISSAGSPEALIRHLVKEKKQSAAENAQLWRLIKKQRTLVAGMNADIAKLVQENERMKLRLREKDIQMRAPRAIQVEVLRKPSPATSVSPAPSEDELPIQRHSVAKNNTIQGSHASRKSQTEEEKASQRPITTILHPLPELSQASSTSGPSTCVESSQQMPTEGIDSRRNTVVQSSIKPIAPLEIHKKGPLGIEIIPSPRTPPAQGFDGAPSPSSFSARRSLTAPRKSANSPLIGSGSPTDQFPATSPMVRKGPPAPLNLPRPQQPAPPTKSPAEYGPEDHSGSDYDEVLEVDEIPAFERGRKKTREEDDKERELIILREQESRSQSKKEKRSESGSKPASKPASASALRPTKSNTELSPVAHPLPISPPIRAFSPNDSPQSLQALVSPHASLAGVLSGPSSPRSVSNSINERTVSMTLPPLSPGLPISPRPGDRPVNSPPPRQPRDGYMASPPLSPRGTLSPPLLSPRAPRHPIPLPPHTPVSLGSPAQNRDDNEQTVTSPPKSPALQPPPVASPKSPKSPQKANAKEPSDTTRDSVVPTELRTGGVSRELVSEAYPDLLLPPNALPSIIVKVTSSRLKPSRHSMIAVKGLEEEPVFTLGISARSDMKQLWRVEKQIMALPQLDQQLKQVAAFDVKLPERTLFTGHAPAKIDARREALEKYFEEVLDTPMNDKAALVLCHFLSTQVIQAEDQEGMKTVGVTEDQQSVTLGPDGKIVKEGYLTKRGKNFGGWKARFFVLDEPTLRYYESPGGALLGTIKLSNAQIGRQSSNHHSQSPSRGGDDPDNQFRHAFLILEPKRKDSSSIMRHVLCAESDAERDEWVVALLQYVGQAMPDSKSKSSSKGLLQTIKKSNTNESAVDRSEAGSVNSLQGMSYEDTAPGQPVRTGPTPYHAERSSPESYHFGGSQTSSHSTSKVISGPTNGGVIQDTGAWGNKQPDSPKAKDKEQKKRSIWGFREKMSEIGMSHSNTSSNSLASRQTVAATRPIFGMPLVEAVENYLGRGGRTPLPAVVHRCLEYLEAKEAVNEEGIFRLSGSNLVIKQLRERFNNDGDLDFLAEDTYYDVHAVASLLKMYLRELPTTVLTRELHLDFLRVMGK